MKSKKREEEYKNNFDDLDKLATKLRRTQKTMKDWDDERIMHNDNAVHNL